MGVTTFAVVFSYFLLGWKVKLFSTCLWESDAHWNSIPVSKNSRTKRKKSPPQKKNKKKKKKSLYVDVMSGHVRSQMADSVPLVCQALLWYLSLFFIIIIWECALTNVKNTFLLFAKFYCDIYRCFLLLFVLECFLLVRSGTIGQVGNCRKVNKSHRDQN